MKTVGFADSGTRSSAEIVMRDYIAKRAALEAKVQDKIERAAKRPKPEWTSTLTEVKQEKPLTPEEILAKHEGIVEFEVIEEAEPVEEPQEIPADPEFTLPGDYAMSAIQRDANESKFSMTVWSTGNTGPGDHRWTWGMDYAAKHAPEDAVGEPVVTVLAESYLTSMIPQAEAQRAELVEESAPEPEPIHTTSVTALADGHRISCICGWVQTSPGMSEDHAYMRANHHLRHARFDMERMEELAAWALQFPGEVLAGERIEPYQGKHHQEESDGYDWSFTTEAGHAYRLWSPSYKRTPGEWNVARGLHDSSFWWAETGEDNSLAAAVAWCRADSASATWAAGVVKQYGHMNAERVAWSAELTETELEPNVWRFERYGRVGIATRNPWGWEARPTGWLAEAGTSGAVDGMFRKRAIHRLTVAGLREIPLERWVITGTYGVREKYGVHGKTAMECGPGSWDESGLCIGACWNKNAPARFVADILAADGSVMGTVGVCALHLARPLAQAQGHIGNPWETAYELCGKTNGAMGTRLEWEERYCDLVAEMVTAALDAWEHNPRPDVVTALLAEAEVVRAKQEGTAARTAQTSTSTRESNTMGRGSLAPKKMTAPKVGDIVFTGAKGHERADLTGHGYGVKMLAGMYFVKHIATGVEILKEERSRAAMKRAILADAVARGVAEEQPVEPATEEQPEPVGESAQSLPRPLRLALEREAAEEQVAAAPVSWRDVPWSKRVHQSRDRYNYGRPENRPDFVPGDLVISQWEEADTLGTVAKVYTCGRWVADVTWHGADGDTPSKMHCAATLIPITREEFEVFAKPEQVEADGHRGRIHQAIASKRTGKFRVTCVCEDWMELVEPGHSRATAWRKTVEEARELWAAHVAEEGPYLDPKQEEEQARTACEAAGVDFDTARKLHGHSANIMKNTARKSSAGHYGEWWVNCQCPGTIGGIISHEGGDSWCKTYAGAVLLWLGHVAQHQNEESAEKSPADGEKIQVQGPGHAGEPVEADAVDVWEGEGGYVPGVETVTALPVICGGLFMPKVPRTLAKIEKQVRTGMAYRVREDGHRSRLARKERHTAHAMLVKEYSGERTDLTGYGKTLHGKPEPTPPAVLEGETIRPMNPGWAQPWWLFADGWGYGFEINHRNGKWTALARLDEWQTENGKVSLPGKLVRVAKEPCAIAEELLDLCREVGDKRAVRDAGTRMVHRVVTQGAEPVEVADAVEAPAAVLPSTGRGYWEIGERVIFEGRAGRVVSATIGKTLVEMDGAEPGHLEHLEPRDLVAEGYVVCGGVMMPTMPTMPTMPEKPEQPVDVDPRRAWMDYPQPAPADPRIAWMDYAQPEPVTEDELVALRAELAAERADFERWSAELDDVVSYVGALVVAAAEEVVRRAELELMEMRTAELAVMRRQAAAVREELEPVVYGPVTARVRPWRTAWGLAASVVGLAEAGWAEGWARGVSG
ncbi:hypothetical protein [Streptomyces xanthophaeus]|nr:hypothetical protein [Streptomyces xanthophaeus]